MSVVRHILNTPKHGFLLLLTAIGLVVTGLVGQGGVAYLTGSSPDQVSVPPWLKQISPAMVSIGVTFILGFFIGVAFRAFLGIATTLLFTGLAILVGLSYLGEINFDLSKAKTTYDTTSAWLSDQTYMLAKSIIVYFHSSAATIAGLFVGYRKR